MSKDAVAGLAFERYVRHLDAETQAWTDAAARGETPLICSDCGAAFSAGMSDKYAYGHERCTKLLARDKFLALGQPPLTQDEIDGIGV